MAGIRRVLYESVASCPEPKLESLSTFVWFADVRRTPAKHIPEIGEGEILSSYDLAATLH